jgi:hypothetical protein
MRQFSGILFYKQDGFLKGVFATFILPLNHSPASPVKACAAAKALAHVISACAWFLVMPTGDWF